MSGTIAPRLTWPIKQRKTGQMTKIDTGKLGERIIIGWERINGRLADPADSISTNNPVDLISDNGRLIEVKAGLIGNSRGSQHWRLTIGQRRGNVLREYLRLTPEQKKLHNQGKSKEIVQRKRKILAHWAKLLERTMYPVTMTVILEPDRKIAHIFEFPDWHARIGWNAPQTKGAYRGAFYYKETGTITKSEGPQTFPSTMYPPDVRQEMMDELEEEALAYMAEVIENFRARDQAVVKSLGLVPDLIRKAIGLHELQNSS